MEKLSPVYRDLQRRIDALPIPFPKTESGVELRLLQHLFSEEEASVACHLSGLSEPLPTIRRRLLKNGLDYSENELKTMLDGLLSKGAIIGGLVKLSGKKVKGYGLMPLAIGMFEMQVDQLTPDYARDFEEYLHGEFGNEISAMKTVQLRTVPVNKSIESQKRVGQYDSLAGYVNGSRGPFAVMNCVCRQAKDLLDDPCDHGDVRETCLSIGSAAVAMSRRGNARLVNREEFLLLLDRAEKKGYVIQPQNTREPNYICCCCGDCCEILQMAKRLPVPVEVFSTNFYAKVDRNTCSGCKRCITRCQMDAVSMKASGDTEVADIDLDRCIGCGLCVTTCRTDSLKLVKKDRVTAPPKNETTMFARMYLERHGILRSFPAAAKVAFKLKL